MNFLDKTQDLVVILHFQDVHSPLCHKGCFYGKVLQTVGPKSWDEVHERGQNNTEDAALGVGSSDLRVGWDSVTFALCDLMVKQGC